MYPIIYVAGPYQAPDPVAIARNNEYARRPPYKSAPFCGHPVAFTESFVHQEVQP
ncbi:Uncharacterised protein [Pseudomonas aeruginosa]|nr:hypothetical protein Q073_01748 [Pseudomonas aeruginosa BL19]CAB5724534.1 Uncharacterised protein [Pseudomonas aeruginosa]